MAHFKFLIAVLLSCVTAAHAQAVLGPMRQTSAMDETLFPYTGTPIYRGALLYGTSTGGLYVNNGTDWLRLSFVPSPAQLGPVFEFAPVDGRGMGTPCACKLPTGTKGELMTFSRASVAECPSNNGQVYTQCPANTPLVASGTAVSAQLGVIRQGASTNLLKHSRDLWPFTDGGVDVWVRSNMTCAPAPTGMRGGTGASRCTAASSGATVLQMITYGAATHSTSMHLSRVSGTGTVEVTRDNGATWTDVSGSLVAGVWKRVVPNNTVGCAGGNCIEVPAMVSGIANPTIGFRLGTSGDVVDWDFGQDEALPFASLPIETLDTNGVRATELISFAAPTPKFVQAGCATATFVSQVPPGANKSMITLVTNTSSAYQVYHYATTPGTARGWDGANEPTMTYVPTPGIAQKWSLAWNDVATPGKMQLINNTAGIQRADSNFSGSMTQTTIWLGGWADSYSEWGVIKSVVLDNHPERCLDGSSLDWLGDSIIAGTGSTSTPPIELGKLLQRVIFNGGVGGSKTADCATRWTSTYRASRSKTLLWSCGVNDPFNSIPGATAAANAIAVFNDALSIGKKVVITGITPCKNSPGWTSAIQTELNTYDSLVSAWAVDAGQVYFDPTATLGGGDPGDGGVDPEVLKAAYDSSDHIHLNAAGDVAFVTPLYPLVPPWP